MLPRPVEALGALLHHIESRAGADVLTRAREVQLLALDVDGVMTDGGLINGAGDEQYKRFHAHDGLGLRLLRESGVELAIITGRRSAVVAERAEEIGARHVFQGQLDKRAAFEQLISDSGLPPTRIAFMGDDIIDLPAMRRAGLALSVAGAHPLVLACSHWQSERPGGSGAVREAAELLMHAQGCLTDAWQQYLA